MLQNLPKIARPDVPYRRCALGTDISRSFYDDLKAIDKDFYLVWHPYSVVWDDIINSGSGTTEVPRYSVQEQYGQLCFGYAMRTANNAGPMPDNSWHLWRLVKESPGWAHVFQLKSTNPEYLSIVIETLYSQKRMLEEFGPGAFTRNLKETDEKKREAALKAKDEMHKLWQKENSWLLKKAMDNMSRGFTEATDPTKDVIVSGAGLSNRSKRVRPVTETEGGIYNGGQDYYVK